MDEPPAFGVGPTVDLNLRVSVATLVRIVFPHPDTAEPLLALEHKATMLYRGAERHLVVKAQPFGGAVRFLHLVNFLKIISKFHFDSERARSEHDFRIFIQPADWEVVREYCLHNFNQEQKPDLETDPSRELVEEFEDALGVKLQPEQYTVKPVRTLVENEPARTNNLQALGVRTVRVYRVFEGKILDPTLRQAMLDNSDRHPSLALGNLARANTKPDGYGQANAMFVVPKHQVLAAYLSLLPDQRNAPLPFMNTVLDSNVPAILDSLHVPKYQISHER